MLKNRLYIVYTWIKEFIKKKGIKGWHDNIEGIFYC